MEDFADDYKYNHCFWKKSDYLYKHAESKYQEFMNIGNVLENISKASKAFGKELEAITKTTQTSGDRDSSRSKGISVFLNSIKNIGIIFLKLSKEINSISASIKEKQFAYDTKNQAIEMCNKVYQVYDKEVINLRVAKAESIAIIGMPRSTTRTFTA